MPRHGSLSRGMSIFANRVSCGGDPELLVMAKAVLDGDVLVLLLGGARTGLTRPATSDRSKVPLFRAEWVPTADWPDLSPVCRRHCYRNFKVTVMAGI